MPECTADATWSGTLNDGEGAVAFESGVWEGTYATPEVADATNPEELLAAAHASCFAMTAAYALAEAGHEVEAVEAESTVHLAIEDGEFWIDAIDVAVTGRSPTAAPAEVAQIVEQAEAYCPVSNALEGTEIRVEVEAAE